MSKEDHRAKSLFQTLSNEGFTRDRSVTRVHRYKGSLKADRREVSIAITFPNLEFTRLPKLTLLNPAEEAPNVVAHLSTSGELCFARNEDLVLDRYDVEGTALMCLELARQGLERALTHKHLEQEIAQEFPQHWSGKQFYFDILATEHKQAKLYRVSRLQGPLLVLSDREDVLKSLIQDKADRKKAISSSRPVFVFHSKHDLTFKQDFRQPDSLAEFMVWLESMLPNIRDKAFNEMTRHFPNHLLTDVFVNAPNGCVGIVANDSHPSVKAAQRRQGLQRIIHSRIEKISVDRYSGTRVDQPFIIRRNMNKHTPLIGRSIALIGCGTIGSHLAKFLVQSGSGFEGGKLLLIDNQSLEPGNVGRHYLGPTNIGESKSNGLMLELNGQFPTANILQVSTDALDCFDLLAQFDLVVDATGEEALSNSINHYFVQQRLHHKVPDVLHVWLFGNGAAAQGLLVDDMKYACFKCLKPDHDGCWRFNPLKSSIEPEQTVAACGEAQFIAYGVAASAMAAALALQIILDWNSRTPTPRMRTIRIEEKDTKEVKNKNPPRSEHCPACVIQTP